MNITIDSHSGFCWGVVRTVVIAEESLKQFEKGINLAQKCQKILNQAEQKIEMLTTNKELPDETA